VVAEFFQGITDWYMANINYGTITALMAVESSFIPFPSEIVVPPAAWKAAQGELNIGLVFLSSTAGALIGAIFNYYFALILGRKIIYGFVATRWARLLLMDKKGIEKAEEYFRRYGRSSTFIGRLVPAIRQLVSLPAGMARMNMRMFLFFTALGSGLWNIILIALGYFLFSQKQVLEKYYTNLSYAFIALAVVFICFVIFKVISASPVTKKEKSIQPEVGSCI
jgi:membrane protein DedA with SNARE-associated domain